MVSEDKWWFRVCSFCARRVGEAQDTPISPSNKQNYKLKLAAAADWVHTSCTFIMLITIMWSLHETKLEGRWFEGSQANPGISILINNSRILKFLCLCSLCARLRVGEAQNTPIPLQTSKLRNSNCSTSCTFIMLIALMWSLHEPKLQDDVQGDKQDSKDLASSIIRAGILKKFYWFFCGELSPFCQ